MYALVSSVPSLDLVDSTMISLESCSYATIMYLYAFAGVIGNQPVWSVEILDENSITDKNTSCDCIQGSSLVICFIVIIYFTAYPYYFQVWVLCLCDSSVVHFCPLLVLPIGLMCFFNNRVLRWFLNLCRMCPFTVCSDFGRYFWPDWLYVVKKLQIKFLYGWNQY